MNLYFFVWKEKRQQWHFFFGKLCRRDILLCLTIYIKDETSLHLLPFDSVDVTRCEGIERQESGIDVWVGFSFLLQDVFFREKYNDTFPMIQPRNCFSKTTSPVTACSNQNNKTKKVRKKDSVQGTFSDITFFGFLLCFDGREGNRAFVCFRRGFNDYGIFFLSQAIFPRFPSSFMTTLIEVLTWNEFIRK